MSADASSVTDLDRVSAYALSQALSRRQLSPVDVVDHYLDRIQRDDGRWGAFVSVYAQDARLAAEAADKAIRSGFSVGPLQGMPIALKDAIEVEGRVVTGGSRYWQDRRATCTAPLVGNLLAQGMVVLGKTHLVEFAFGGWGTNQHMGTPLNPWDPRTPRTPGGSSSGSGVAVAADLVPWAVGTDTGGSVRLPASFCGLSALKPTVGRISTEGVLPLSHTLDTPGPMARSVRDAALLYAALRTDQPVRAGSRQALDWVDALGTDVRGLRLGRMPEAERHGVQPAVLAAYDAALAQFADLGAEIVTLTLPCSLADLAEMNGLIICAEAYRLMGHLVEDASLPLDDDVRPRVLGGRATTARDYLDALDRRESIKRQFSAALSGVHALLTPATGMAALPLQDADQRSTPAYFTRFANLLDLCAVALPNGMTPDGLPTSLQIACAAGEEALALRIGLAFQQATDWHQRRPPAVA